MFSSLFSSAQRESLGIDDLIIEAQNVAESTRLGGHRKRKSGSGEQFWQFRPYDSASDTPQNIDWRQSAKSSRLEVRDQEWQIPQTTYICVDQSANMHFASDKKLRTKSETAQILSLALTLLITNGGNNIAAHGITAGHSKRTIEHFAQTLIDDGQNTQTPPLDIGKTRNANAILIGDFWDDLNEIETRISSLAETISRGFIIHIIDPAELNLSPYHGRTVFKDLTQNHDTDIPSISSIRDAYSAKIQAHCDALSTLAAHYGFEYLAHKTDESIKDTLLAIQERASL